MQGDRPCLSYAASCLYIPICFLYRSNTWADLHLHPFPECFDNQETRGKHFTDMEHQLALRPVVSCELCQLTRAVSAHCLHMLIDDSTHMHTHTHTPHHKHTLAHHTHAHTQTHTHTPRTRTHTHTHTHREQKKQAVVNVNCDRMVQWLTACYMLSLTATADCHKHVYTADTQREHKTRNSQCELDVIGMKVFVRLALCSVCWKHVWERGYRITGLVLRLHGRCLGWMLIEEQLALC